MSKVDVIIIGGGAAGLMAAITAGNRGRKVLVLDHADKTGKKILISGGGRCNFTNSGANSTNYLSENPHFCKSALARYTSSDFIALIEKHKIPYYEKKLGQLFCKNSAQDIITMLLAECRIAGVEIINSTKILEVIRKDNSFAVSTSKGLFTCQSLVMATGGLSIPKIGATDFGYKIAKQFGLKIIPQAPALDGFVWNEKDHKLFSNLSGISLDVMATCSGKSFRENLLFTHVGLSGPAMLQASLYWKPKEKLLIDLAPDKNLEKRFLDEKKSGSKKEIKTILANLFPDRLAEVLTHLLLKNSKPVHQLSDDTLKKLAEDIHHFTITPERTVGYSKAEVTKGGVSTDELSSQTMECKKIPGLYFVGEVIDVTGQLGGYNFQWAWASGWVAGKTI